MTKEPNKYTIGVELCHKDASGDFTEATIYYGAKLVASIVGRHGLHPFSDVIRHFDVTGKVCPRYWVIHKDLWDGFLLRIKANLSGG